MGIQRIWYVLLYSCNFSTLLRFIVYDMARVFIVNTLYPNARDPRNTFSKGQSFHSAHSFFQAILICSYMGCDVEVTPGRG